MSTSIRRRVQRLAQITLALGAIVVFSAFRHTDVEGFTDPDYAGYTFRTVVVQFPNANLSFRKYAVAQLEKRLKKYDVRIVLHNDLFAPTREWTEEEMREIYERNNIDAGIVITVGRTGSNTTPGGVLYNSTTINGTTSGYATQVTYFSDHASFEIAIVDVATKDTVWLGNLATRGAGLMFTGTKSTAKGLIKGLVREWQAAGHLQR